MSLLARLCLIASMGLVVFLGFWFWESKQEKAERTEQRFSAFLERSIAEPGSTISQLNGLLESDEISDKELLLLFELILDSPDHAVAPMLPYLEAMLAREPSVDWQVMEACVMYRQGKIADSRNKLQKIASQNPAHRRANYEHQRITWIIGGVDERVGARIALTKLANEEDRWGYKALRALAFSSPRPGILKEDLIKALEALRTHKFVSSADYLKASEILLEVDETRKFEQIFEEIKSFEKGGIRKVDLGYWLIQNGQLSEALNLVSPEDAQAGEDFFFVRFQALLETNQTMEAQKLFEQAAHLSDAKKLQANAYLEIVKGDTGALAQFLQNVRELNSAESLLNVSRLALLRGNGAVAYQAFQEAWAIDPAKFNHSQANQFLQISLVSRNTRGAHQITGEIYRRYPEKFGNANNHCYLSLLLGDDVDALEQEASRIVEAFPGSPTFLSTLALAKLLSGKPKEALEVMNRRGRVPLNHGERALLACILKASGNREDAKKIAEGLTEQRMLPEEWELLKKFRLV